MLLFIFSLLFLFLFLVQKKEYYFDIPSISSSDNKILIQTYKDKKFVPQDVFDNIKKYARGYNYIFLNDNQCIDFLQKNYGDTIVKIYKRFPKKAHSADLFRYCWLYKYGGVYLDIKTELIKHLDDIFIFDDKTISSVLSFDGKSIYQGIICSPPGQQFFLNLISFVLYHHKFAFISTEYHIFIKDFYRKIKTDIQKTPQIGMNIGHRNNYFLFQEKCYKNASLCHDGLDRYGRCCWIVDPSNKNIIKTRRSSFPWV